MVQRLRRGAPDWTGEITGVAGHCTTHRYVSDDGAASASPRPGADPWFENALPAADICNGHGDDSRACPLRSQCLMFAMINNEVYGVWGGMTQEDRRWMRLNMERSHWGWYPPGSFVPVAADADDIIIVVINEDGEVAGELEPVVCV
jgi:Transcription factor WhiB